MSLIGEPTESQVADAWMKSMKDVVEVESQDKIPELNLYQCGTAKMHSLDEAKDTAKLIIDQGIGINHNDEITLSEEMLKKLEA